MATTSICRICLNQVNANNSTSLFFKSEINHVLTNAEIIMQLTDVTYQENDCFPQKICYDCLLKLSMTFEFVQLVETSDKILREQEQCCENDTQYESPFEKEKSVEKDVKYTIKINREEKRDFKETKFKAVLLKKEGKVKSKKKKESMHIRCMLCSSYLFDETELSEHLEEKHWKAYESGVRYLECQECNTIFLTYRNLRIHIEKTHNEKHENNDQENQKDYTCILCSKNMKNSRRLKKHLEKNHWINEDSSPYLQCRVCQKIFTDYRFLKEHILMIHKDKRQESETVKTENGSLKMEKKDNNTNDGEPIKCFACDEPFELRKQVSKHIRDVHMNENKQYVCPICDKLLKFNYQNLRNHIMSYHQKDPRYRSKHKMNSRKLKGKNKAKNYLCPHCGHVFAESGNLKQHMMIHEGKKQFGCDQCDRKFYFPYMVEKHKRVFHSTEKNFMCEICEKRFAISDQLRMHLSSHRTEKNYACLKCHKLFQSRGKLNGHMKYHGQKNYACEYCSKSFVMEKNLKIHRYTHTGERPRACQYCDKRFAQWTSLKYHISRYHNCDPKQDVIS